MKLFEFHHVSQKTDRVFTLRVPAKFVVCSECQGSGTVLRDGLRGHAFSSEELFEDPSFARGYFGGDFDVQCDLCHGEKVVLEPDESRMTKRQKFLYDIAVEQAADAEAEARHYRMLRDAGVEF